MDDYEKLKAEVQELAHLFRGLSEVSSVKGASREATSGGYMQYGKAAAYNHASRLVDELLERAK